MCTQFVENKQVYGTLPANGDNTVCGTGTFVEADDPAAVVWGEKVQYFSILI